MVRSVLLCSVSGMMYKVGIYDGMSGWRGFVDLSVMIMAMVMVMS